MSNGDIAYTLKGPVCMVEPVSRRGLGIPNDLIEEMKNNPNKNYIYYHFTKDEPQERDNSK